MSNVLFVLWAGGGNVPPQLVLARAMAARGHSVRVLAPACLRARIEAAGLDFEPYRQAPEHDESDEQTSLIRDFEPRTPIGQVTNARDRLLAGMARPIAHDVLDVLEHFEADVIAPDWMLVGATIAAESKAVPAAPLVHSVFPFPAKGAPPFGTGWAPGRGPFGRLRDAVGYAGFRAMMGGPLRAPINAVRRDLGLGELADGVAAFTRAPRVLVLTSAAFDFPAERPDHLVYVGPQLASAEGGMDIDVGGPDPVVLVALSTTYQNQGDLLRRVVRGLGDRPVQVLVGTGPVTLRPEDIPPNATVRSSIPHEVAMRSADVVVTHAGHGTVMTALAHGVPLVCLPVSRDQPDVAARVVHAGAGLRLSPRSSPRKIANAVDRVLAGRQYAAAAGRLQRAIAAERGAQRAVTELELLAGANLRAPLDSVQ